MKRLLIGLAALGVALAALGAQPQLKTLQATWEPYAVADYPGGSNAVITLYKSTSLGTVWTPFKPTSITPAGRTSQVFQVIVPNKFRFYTTATIQGYGESDPSNTVTNDYSTTSAILTLQSIRRTTTTTNETRPKPARVGTREAR